MGSLIICVRLSASSLDCRMAQSVKHVTGHLAAQVLKLDGWAINSHMVSRAQLGAEGGL